MTSVAIDQRWVFHDETVPEQAGEGVTRRVLAYAKDVMCVESTFKKGAVGAFQCHENTQITYVVSGVFECEIGGVLLDIFAPMRGELLD